MRTIRTGQLVLLSLAAGLFLGLLVGREWALGAERSMARTRWLAQREFAATYDPRQDTARWREDSLRAWRRSQAMEPREIARAQALQHCIVSLFFDTGGTEMEMFNVTAYADGFAALGRGWLYRADGFPRGSRADVVLPYTQCRHIRHLGFEATSIPLPWLEHPDTGRENVQGMAAGLPFRDPARVTVRSAR